MSGPRPSHDEIKVSQTWPHEKWTELARVPWAVLQAVSFVERADLIHNCFIQCLGNLGSGRLAFSVPSGSSCLILWSPPSHPPRTPHPFPQRALPGTCFLRAVRHLPVPAFTISPASRLLYLLYCWLPVTLNWHVSCFTFHVCRPV